MSIETTLSATDIISTLCGCLQAALTTFEEPHTFVRASVIAHRGTFERSPPMVVPIDGPHKIDISERYIP
jgi:hypothetical protein